MTFATLLDSFQGRRVLVVGDLMLDRYLVGRATRISQEAPVMVIRQDTARDVPGGAANVAANLVALGATVSVLGVVGNDEPGRTLSAAMESSGIGASGIVMDPSRPTTTKTRILANHNQQVMRIDHEATSEVDESTQRLLVTAVGKELPKCDVVLLSDYRKGAVSPGVIQETISATVQQGKPVVANAKPSSLRYYAGASLVSLNRFEAAEAARLPALPDEDALAVAKQLQKDSQVDRILITLGGSGMVAAAQESFSVPAVRVDVYDEAGAGDTVIATIALGIGAGAFSRELLSLATQTAAAVVRKVGVATPTPEDLDEIRFLA